MSKESWPPALKDWVAKCLGEMTDSNRVEAQKELRQVIADAFSAQTLWTTDWSGIQLQSLISKPAINFNQLKRKSDTSSPKKNKKHKQNAPPILDYNEQVTLNRRAERFQREHELERQKGQRNGGQTSHQANQQHAHLFNNSAPAPSVEADPNVIDWDRFTIVGTSKEIFKDYLRLTSEPKPEQIRPYSVLQETLVQLKARWKKDPSYPWICNQFKSLRQDLTVQRIKNEFTVSVYEQHARMALEVGDMVEYNQCQATLKVLYELGIPGRHAEFTAYRILMLLHGRNSSELNLYVGQLTPHQKADKAVRHALDVQRSLAMGNYHKLFQLYHPETCPNMGLYIMDHFIDRERVKALIIMTKAYMSLPLNFIRNELAFDSLQAAREFLASHSAHCFRNPNDNDPDLVLEGKLAHPQLVQSFDAKYRKVAIKGAI